MKWTYLLLIPLLSSCALFGPKIQKPKVRVEAVKVRDVNLPKADLIFDLWIDNPNKFELKVDEVEYALKIDGKNVGQGALKDLPGIPAEASGNVHIPVTVNLAALVGSLTDLLLADKVTPYEITGKATSGWLRLPFREVGELVYKDGTIKKAPKRN